jgi:hypothetical protein
MLGECVPALEAYTPLTPVSRAAAPGGTHDVKEPGG